MVNQRDKYGSRQNLETIMHVDLYDNDCILKSLW